MKDETKPFKFPNGFNPFLIWNDPYENDDPNALWNREPYRSDVRAPWNNPGADDEEDLEEYKRIIENE